MHNHLSRAVSPWLRALALLGATTFLGLTLGCMSLNIGGRTEVVEPADPHLERGSLTVPAHQSIDVYYPNPYVATPNLTVENAWNDCKIEEQQPNHFRIYNPGPFSRDISWKTRGEKMPKDALMQTAKAALGTPTEVPPTVTAKTNTTVAVER